MAMLSAPTEPMPAMGQWDTELGAGLPFGSIGVGLLKQ